MYLGKEIRRTERGFELTTNSKLIDSYIKVCGVESGKGVNTPTVKYSQEEELATEAIPKENITGFRSKLGKLLAISHD